MPDYLASGWALLDFSGALAADATGTTGSGLIGTPTTPDAGADRLSLYIKDDDDQLKDADIETGTLSVLTNDLTIAVWPIVQAATSKATTSHHQPFAPDHLHYRPHWHRCG